jgi:hypothetical protein
MTDEKIDRFLNPFFNLKFEGAEVDTRDYDDGKWIGVWKKNDLLVGAPVNDNDGNWYSNGQILGVGLKLNDLITHRDFYNSMKRYLKQVYPQLKIREVY